MPADTFHVTKAERNEQFCHNCNLKQSQYHEWTVVVLFYSAMHYIDAVLYNEHQLIRDHRNPRSHIKRKIAVSKSSKLAPVASLYLDLYDRSLDARYKQISFPSNTLSDIEQKYFQPIRKHSRKQLGLSP